MVLPKELLQIVSIAQKSYDFYNARFKDEVARERFEILKSMIEKMTEESFKFKFESEFRRGMRYLSEALCSSNTDIKNDNIKEAFHCFTSVVEMPIPEEEKALANMERMIVACYWGRYIYYGLHNDKINMIRQVMDAIVVSPSFSMLFFPSVYFLEDELRLVELEKDIIGIWHTHPKNMKNLGEVISHFGTFYCQCDNAVSSFKIFDKLDEIDQLNEQIRNRAKKTMYGAL